MKLAEEPASFVNLGFIHTLILAKGFLQSTSEAAHGPCEFFRVLNQAPILLEDVKKIHFTKAEHARVNTLMCRYLTGEPRFRTFIEALVKISVLRAFLESLPATDPVKGLLEKAKELQDEGDQRSKRLFAVSRAQRWDPLQTKVREFEMRTIEEIHLHYYPVARAEFRQNSIN